MDSLLAVASILDRSISIFARNPFRVLAIMFATLAVLLTLALLIWALLLRRYVDVSSVYADVIVGAPPLAAAALSELARRPLVPQSLISVIGSGWRRVGAQLAVVVVIAPLSIFALLASMGMMLPYVQRLLSPYPGMSRALEPASVVLILAIPCLLIVTLLGIASIAVCIIRWEPLTWIGALRAAVARLFSRERGATSLFLLFALVAVQMFVFSALNVVWLWVGQIQMWEGVVGLAAGQVLFSTYACLSFATYYLKLAPHAVLPVETSR